MLVLANALRLWFGLGLTISLIGMALGIREAFITAAVFGVVMFVLGRLVRAT